MSLEIFREPLFSFEDFPLTTCQTVLAAADEQTHHAHEVV